MDMTIRPIDTLYRGYRFRSRLEARWAVFFDTLGVKWEYEPQGFVLPSGACYLPDFWLPDVQLRDNDGGVWVEVKGTYPAREEAVLIEEFGGAPPPREPPPLDDSFDPPFDGPKYDYPPLGGLSKCRIGEPIVLVVGLPAAYPDGGHEQMGPSWDNNMAWMRCDSCGQVKIDFVDSSYMICRCGGSTTPYGHHFLAAETRARSARFEHGQNPDRRFPRL